MKTTPSRLKYFFTDIKEVFFYTNFREKYCYLGCVPINEDGKIFSALLPLILTMDYYARPWWCPRFFLRFLHVFGNGSSVFWIKNSTLHNLHKKITKGIMIVDYKTKFSDYDLRISIWGPQELIDLAEAIENSIYTSGRKAFLIKELLEIDPTLNSPDLTLPMWKIHQLEDLLRIKTESK